MTTLNEGTMASKTAINSFVNNYKDALYNSLRSEFGVVAKFKEGANNEYIRCKKIICWKKWKYQLLEFMRSGAGNIDKLLGKIKTKYPRLPVPSTSADPSSI